MKLLTKQEVADMLGKTRRTLTLWIATGYFPPPTSRLRGAGPYGSPRWRASTVEDWVKDREREQAAIRGRGPTKRREQVAV